MSAPRSSGRESTGVAIVLSQASSAPERWAISAQAAMSVIESRGLPGDSTQMRRVAGVTARATASVSQVSTAVRVMPCWASTLLKSRQVPP